MGVNELYVAVLPMVNLSERFGHTEQFLTMFPDRKFATEFFEDEVDAHISTFERRANRRLHSSKKLCSIPLPTFRLAFLQLFDDGSPDEFRRRNSDSDLLLLQRVDNRLRETNRIRGVNLAHRLTDFQFVFLVSDGVKTISH